MNRTFTLVLMILTMALSAAARTGDVNGDSEVNISDVNAVIDIILTGSGDAAGDVNGDSEINISDINAVIDIILGGDVDVEITHPRKSTWTSHPLSRVPKPSRTMRTLPTMATLSRTRPGQRP